MTVQVEEKYNNNLLSVIRIFRSVTEIKEVMNHTGDFNGITDEVNEYLCYCYEVWSNNNKLGTFYKNENTKISIRFNENEKLQ